MSPSANNLAKRINRDLTQGDVLLRTYTDSGITMMTEAYEVVSPHVTGKRKKPLGLLLGLLGMKVEADCVEVRKLTQHGPVEQTHLHSRDDNRWTDVIRTENRTDRPSLRER